MVRTSTEGPGSSQEAFAYSGSAARSESVESPKMTPLTSVSAKTSSTPQLSTSKKIASLLSGVLIGLGAAILIGGLVSNPIGWALLAVGTLALLATLAASKNSRAQVMKWATAGVFIGGVGGAAALTLGAGAAVAAGGSAIGGALSSAGSALASFAATKTGTAALVATGFGVGLPSLVAGSILKDRLLRDQQKKA